MKKIIAIVLTGLVTFFIGVQMSAAQEKSGLKKISLVYSDFSTPDSGGITFFKKEYLPRIQKMIAKAGYELEVTYHHNETLYKLADEVEACAAGLVDITLFPLDYETERAPLHEILNMPLMGYNEYSASRIWFDLQKTIPEFGAELADVKELAHFMALPAVFNMNKVARTPADFKGLTIQSSGLPAELFQSVGAVTIAQSPTEWRSSLENNLLSGIAGGITGITMFNLQDVVKNHIFPTGDSLGLSGTGFIMNRQKYESLPPEVRKAIDDSVSWASNRLAEIEVKNIPANIEKCRKAGNKIIKLTPEEMEEWHKVVKPVHENWIKKMEAMGLPGKKVYDEARRLAEKYKDMK